jgi:hypothetical protein
MGKAKLVGHFKPYLPNSRADMRRTKQFRRNREYTDRHEEVMAEKREILEIRRMEAVKRGN